MHKLITACLQHIPRCCRSSSTGGEWFSALVSVPFSHSHCLRKTHLWAGKALWKSWEMSWQETAGQHSLGRGQKWILCFPPQHSANTGASPGQTGGTWILFEKWIMEFKVEQRSVRCSAHCPAKGFHVLKSMDVAGKTLPKEFLVFIEHRLPHLPGPSCCTPHFSISGDPRALPGLLSHVGGCDSLQDSSTDTAQHSSPSQRA